MGGGSQIEEVFEVALAVDYAEDGDIGADNAVDDYVLAYGEAASAGAEIIVAGATGVGEVCEKEANAG